LEVKRTSAVDAPRAESDPARTRLKALKIVKCHSLEQTYLDITDPEILPDGPYQEAEDLSIDERQHV
jgi:hypothetical protein